jgi:hypothetical protein
VAENNESVPKAAEIHGRRMLDPLGNRMKFTDLFFADRCSRW